MGCEIDKQAAKEAFARDGYVFFKGFMNSDEISALQTQVDRFIADVVPTLPRDQVFYEDKSRPDTLKQIQRLWIHDPAFERLMIDSPFREVAELLLDDDVVPKNLQYFNKPPGVGQATPPHQDGYYFMLQSCEAVTMWLALDVVDEANGCVRYVRGSHHHGMRPHGRTQTLGFSQGITDYGTAADMRDEIAFPAAPGDLLVHHALTIHRADGNGTHDRTRKAIGFIYYGARAREDAEAKAAYQRKLADELAVAGKI